MTASKHPPDPSFEIRCPRLGHQINFTYCRSENNGLPCFKTLDCWHHYFDVHTFIKEALSPEEFKRIFLSPSQPKIFSLMDLIAQAKQSQTDEDKDSKD